MEFDEVVRTAGTCRYYKPDPVPDDVLARALDASRYAPTGGNVQPVRFVVVRDAERRGRLAELYLPLWESYARSAASRAVQSARPSGRARRMFENADHFARHLAEIPVHVVVCAVLSDILATDAGLGRLSLVGGASVYPSVENLLLACRAEGLGAALTTLLCYEEAAVRELCAIPEGVATAAMVAIGWPERPFPRRLARRPLAEVAFAEKFGEPLAV